MKHLILCREYPPAPGGGIGTYVFHVAHLLAESGETVHVICQAWKGAELEVDEECAGRLIVHRLRVEDWDAVFRPRPHPSLGRNIELALFQSGFYPQCFAWLAGLLAERLIEKEGIDLIEAQEYEAPLYYLMLRRALGLGPRRQPPCIVHLHSPTEFIARYNDWSADSRWVQTAKRLEDYCIAAADALLCPSRTFARQAEVHYGLASGQIQVIPLPFGSSDSVIRPAETWERGTVSYVGRLERRKGIIEWIQASMAVAREFPEARFEFVGANILSNDRISSEAMVQEMIPADLKSRFIFRGEQERASLPGFLSKARLAAIPSRWENFPNSCIEAMASGLPVIATRNGGMVEMIEDGRTGWLAQRAGSEGLAEALRRALATPSHTLAEMGGEASQAIRRLCDNQQVLARHLEFRHRTAAQTVQRSIHLPANLPNADQPFAALPQRKASRHRSAQGMAIIISSAGNARSLRATLQSIAEQTQEPLVVVFASPGIVSLQALAKDFGWNCIFLPLRNEDSSLARIASLQAIAKSRIEPMGLVFLEAGQRLGRDYIEACEAALQHCPEVGLVSFWTRINGRDYNVRIHPCPSFPYQHRANEVSSASAMRIDALSEVNNLQKVFNQGQETWEMSNALMADDWVAVTLPRVLVDEPAGKRAALPGRDRSSGYDPWARYPNPGLIMRHPISSAKIMIKLSGQIATRIYRLGIRSLKLKDRRD